MSKTWSALNDKQFRGIENKPMFEAHVARSQSGAAGSHLDRRDRRARTRQAAVQRAIKETE